MEFNYFHIPTRIIQGYESYTNLREMTELSKKRVIMVVDKKLVNLGVTQNLRRFIENISYGLILHELSIENSFGLTDDLVHLVKNSHAQTLIGFGNTSVLSVARAMAQFGSTSENPIAYVEIPSLPCIYTGLLETYYISANFETLKKPYRDLHSRAQWLILDSSYTEFIKIEDMLESSMQSLAYAFDTLLSRNVTMLAESYAYKAIELIISAGNRLPNEPTNIKIKSELMLGSLLASFAIQSSSLGISAGLAMALENSRICSEVKGAGAVLISTLEYSLVTNLDKLQKLSRVLGLEDDKDPLESSMNVIKLVQNLLKQMEIKQLSSYSYSNTTLDIVAKQASRYNFMLDLSRPAGFYELTDIINNAAANGFELSSDGSGVSLDKLKKENREERNEVPAL